MNAVIWGVTGQSGSYLAEELLSRGYKVYGIRRRTASGDIWRLNKVINNPNFQLLSGDITDQSSIYRTLGLYPDVIYNAAAQSHVHESFNQPLSTWEITAAGHLALLEAVRLMSPRTQVVFFASSEMFGNSVTKLYKDFAAEQCGLRTDKEKVKDGVLKFVQNEDTPFSPQSPYAIAKLAAFNATKLYREAYGMKCFSGIMFNKESPRRGINFVTRKITSYFNQFWPKGLYKCGFISGQEANIPKLKLGNLKAYRDWSYVPDIMSGLVDLAESPLNNDYVFCTGETHTIEEFLDEVGKYHKLDWKEYVEIDKSLFRPAEVKYLCGDASKIKNDLGWTPKVKFKELVQIMCENENGKS